MTLAELLMEMRKARGISQRKAAKEASISNSTLSKIEHGEIRPGVELMERLAGIYKQESEVIKKTAGVCLTCNGSGKVLSY